KFDADEFVRPIAWHGKGFAVPADSSGQIGGAAGVRRGKRVFDGEIMRDIQPAPGAIVEIRCRRVLEVAQMKAPIEIKALAGARGSFSVGQGGTRRQRKGQEYLHRPDDAAAAFPVSSEQADGRRVHTFNFLEKQAQPNQSGPICSAGVSPASSGTATVPGAVFASLRFKVWRRDAADTRSRDGCATFKCVSPADGCDVGRYGCEKKMFKRETADKTVECVSMKRICAANWI